MQNKLKSAFESAILKSGVFFHHQQWKEVFIFLFFLLLAFVFWLLHSLQEESERRFELALRYKNIPDEWTLSDDNPNTISVILKDKGISLLYYFWNKRYFSIDVSVSDLQQISDTTLQIPNRILEAGLAKQLITSTSIISFEPQEIRLHYDLLSSRLTPVIANVIIATKQGFQVSDSISILPPEVRLFGSSKVLDTLNQVKTNLVQLEGIATTREMTVRLDLPAGVKAEIETVKLTIPVEEFTEKKISLPVISHDIPENYILRIFPSSVEIACNLPLSQFRELTEEMFEILIPFSEFEENQATGKIPVRLTRRPSWVSNPVIIPGEVEFIIEHHD